MQKSNKVEYMVSGAYRGVTLDQARGAIAEMTAAVFDLFDATGNKYKNRNRGMSLLWTVSFTTQYTARDAVDRFIAMQNVPLAIAWLLVLSEMRAGYARDDLLAVMAHIPDDHEKHARALHLSNVIRDHKRATAGATVKGYAVADINYE